MAATSETASCNSLAIGSERFVVQQTAALGIQAKIRQVAADEAMHTLREPAQACADHARREKAAARGDNVIFWQTISRITSARRGPIPTGTPPGKKR
jgi:hypothetical protein